MEKLRNFLIAGSVSVWLVACSDDGVEVLPGDDTDMQSQEQGNEATADIVDTAIAAGSFTTLAAALEATDLVSVLGDDSRQFTVFAPTNEAFAALGDETITALLADPDTLRDILLYHVLADTAVNADTAIGLAGSTVTTANGDDLALSLNDGNLFVNLSQVTTTDIAATNGIIHVIDQVLTPPAEPDAAALVSIVDTAVAAGSFSTLVTALQATGLDATLASTDGSYTVFAPTDDAFAKLGGDTINSLLADPDALADILLYHVVAGEPLNSTDVTSLAGSSVSTVNGASVAISHDGDTLRVNQSDIVIADVHASNGIIHAIDTVLLPPADSAGPTDDAPAAETGTLLDVARAAGNFSTLVAALEAAGLDGAIGHSGDLYTVFAPTDEAFAALGQDTIDALLADPAALRDILLYHVIPGTVVESDAALSLIGTSIEAGNGDRFELSLQGDQLFVNDSQVIATDIRGVNGVIHVIDAVLIPPQ